MAVNVPTLSLTSQYGDTSTYAVIDALGFTASQTISLQNLYKMQYGASAIDANDTTTVLLKYYEGQHVITIASSTFDIDLTLLADRYGNVLNFQKINKIIIHNNDLSGGSGLLIGGAASNAWTALFNGSSTLKIPIAPLGTFVQENPIAGFTVNSGSKVLRIANDAASPSGAASFNIHLWGT